MSSEELRGQSIGDLLNQLSEQIATLVRQELYLARAEMEQKARRAGRGLGLIGVGGVVALAAVGALTATLIMLLAQWMDGWLAGLVVTIAFAVIAALLGMRGKETASAATPPVPEQTIESVKEDVQWAKTQIKSGSE